MSNILNITNQKFGKLTAIRRLENDKWGKTIWECKCECGNISNWLLSNLKSKVRYNRPISCGCIKAELLHHKLWKGFGEISGDYWSSLKKGAISRNFDFLISIEYAWNLFLKQERKCALTGDEISLFSRRKKREQTASLDRIDSSKGYIEGNLQWIHKKLQQMKMNMPDEDFIFWCTKVATYNEFFKFKTKNSNS